MKRIVFLGVILCLCSAAVFASCTEPAPVSIQSPEDQEPSEETSLPSPSERVPRITVEELFQKMEAGDDILIIDTRADVEAVFDAGHIKGAVIVPLSEIFDGRWVPPPDKEKTIILYCT